MAALAEIVEFAMETSKTEGAVCAISVNIKSKSCLKQLLRRPEIERVKSLLDKLENTIFRICHVVTRREQFQVAAEVVQSIIHTLYLLRLLLTISETILQKLNVLSLT